MKPDDVTEFSGQTLIVTTSRAEQPRWIPLDDRAARRRFPAASGGDIPVGYVPTRFLASAHLADLWDGVALTANDEWITKALQIIEPRVQGLAFVKRAEERLGLPRFGLDRAAIIKLKDIKRPVPLNSMGDGMVRILPLILSLFPAKGGGFYLVDELENGLHYSVQKDLWSMLFEFAESLDIQVFAATHSWDCIEAFAQVACERSEPSVLVRVGKSVLTSEAGRSVATLFDRDSLAAVTQAEVEVR